MVGLEVFNGTNIDSLRGPGFEVVVGYPDEEDFDAQSTWCLPQALVSHYSPVLRAACERNFKEREEKRIELPDMDPKIFALFVEWMYYGRYTPPRLLPFSSPTTPVDAEVWILGDALLCTPLKNYAMKALYSQMTSLYFMPITADMVRFVLDNSTVGSALSRLYLDYMMQYWDDNHRVSGSVEDWDELFQEHAHARMMHLKTSKLSPQTKRSLFKKEEAYLETSQLAIGAPRSVDERLSRMVKGKLLLC